jgi:hypothetical protein
MKKVSLHPATPFTRQSARKGVNEHNVRREAIWRLRYFMSDSDASFEQVFRMARRLRENERIQLIAILAQELADFRRADGTTVEEDWRLPEGAVMLDPDVRAYFPDSAAVNKALRGLIKLIPDSTSSE